MKIVTLGENTCDFCRLRAKRTYGIKHGENTPVAVVLCIECLFKLSKAIEENRERRA